MWPWFERVLDIVLPRADRVVRLGDYSAEALVCDTLSFQHGDMPIISLMSYRTVAVEDCIRTLKYHRQSRAAELLAQVLSGYLTEEAVSLRMLSERDILLVPIPLHPARERERGFNHVLRILEHLPTELRDGTITRVDPHALIRTRDTAQQAKLPRRKRLSNVCGAFAVSDPERIRQAHVFLIDDVVTTGATLCEAARPLRALGCPVTLLALARA